MHTLPSAHSIISSKGRSARYIVVVFHHIGRPKNRTISQKERMMKDRRRTCAGFSGGGCLRPEVGAGTVVAESCSTTSVDAATGLLLPASSA